MLFRSHKCVHIYKYYFFKLIIIFSIVGNVVHICREIFVTANCNSSILEFLNLFLKILFLFHFNYELYHYTGQIIFLSPS